MADLEAVMAAAKTAMQTAMPMRVITRSYKDFSLRSDADLRSGIWTLISTGEKDYANYKGREAQLGTLTVAALGQVRVDDNSSEEAIETAEFAMVEELKAFVRGELAAAIDGGALMKSFRQSGQMEHPYGWVAVEIEIARNE